MAQQQPPLRVIPTRQRITQLPPAPTVQAVSDQTPKAQVAKPVGEPPQTPEEAKQRFFARYGFDLIAALLDLPEPPNPITVADWTQLAELTRDVLRAQQRLAEATRDIKQARAQARIVTGHRKGEEI